MAHGFDIEAVMKAMLRKILGSTVLLILCTDSKSLLKWLVKLDTIQEKQLMVDIMSLCESYKQKKITEVK